MAQVRYDSCGGAVRKADSLANIIVDRDVVVVAASQYPSVGATEPTVIVVEVGPRKWVVLKSDGNGTWTEQ